MDWVETNGVVLRYELSGTGHMPLLLIQMSAWHGQIACHPAGIRASPGRRARDRRDSPLTVLSVPSMLRAVRCAEERPQAPARLPCVTREEN
jgi:hypothetical protein